MDFNYFDLHSHPHFKDFDEDRESLILEMKEKGIGTIAIGTDLEESKKAIELAEKYENIFASVGFHPADNSTEVFNYDEYLELAKHNKVLFIGECGLDYFHHTKSREDQVKLFKEQIRLAIEVNKPLMLHVRPKENNDAYFDAIEILKEEKQKNGGNLKGNFHFFVGDISVAKKVLDLGFTVSLCGVITFAKEYEEMVKFMPIESIHAETDSPYVAPKPNRGKRNSPLNVIYVVEKIAEIKGVNVEEVKEQLKKNVLNTFKL